MADVDQMNRNPRNAQEIIDWDVYSRLAMEERKRGHLSKASIKRFNRARERLLRAGMIKTITRSDLELAAREMYAQMPKWKRMLMRLRFWWRAFRTRK